MPRAILSVVRRTTVSALALVLPCTAIAQSNRPSAPRFGSADARGARVINVSNGSGRLVVEGRPGTSTVTVTATAYARSSSDLDHVQLRVARNGDAITVEPDYPHGVWGSGCDCYMDITVQVPASVPLEIRDGSGGAQIRDVGALSITSGSGGISITRAGALDVKSGSGHVNASDIRGDVRASTGSGGVTLDRVTGSVTIEHAGSGSVRLTDIGKDVRVGSIGSGNVDANGVGGDLTVDHAGSGGIHYTAVRGRVIVPSRWRSGDN